jgi:hypothetical protein
MTNSESQILKYLSTTQNRLNLVLRHLEKRTLEQLSDPDMQLRDRGLQSPPERIDVLIINLLEEISDQVLGISRYLTILEKPDDNEEL